MPLHSSLCWSAHIPPIHLHQDLHSPHPAALLFFSLIYLVHTASSPHQTLSADPLFNSTPSSSSSSSSSYCPPSPPSIHSMASTSDSLPSSPSLPTTAALDAGADQEFTSHHHNLFLPCSSSPTSLYLDSSFHGLLPTTSSAAAMSSPSPPPPPPHAPPPLPPHPGTSKPAKKRPRASRRPPTTVLNTDTSNFRAMVQEFTGFPAPPFAAEPPPAVRPRFLGGPPFFMRPSPLKYPQSSMLLPPSSCTTTTLANTAINNTATASSNHITTASTSSLVDALALFAKSNVVPGSAGASTTMPGGSGASAADHHHYHGIGMGGFNPFDDFENPAAEESERINGASGSHGFFSSFAAGDKFGGRH